MTADKVTANRVTGIEVAFLLGIPRSGTTLLSYLLDRHPDIAVPPEPWLLLALDAFGRTCIRHPASSHYLGQAIDELAARIDLTGPKRALAQAVYDGIGAAAGKRVVVDKTPRYYQILPLLDALFPTAPRILLRRNPFAVAASMKTSWGLDLIGTLRNRPDHPLIVDLVLGPRRLEAYAAAATGPLHMLSYEALVREPQARLAALHRLLGVPAETADAAVAVAGSAFATASLGDRRILARTTVDTDSLERWSRELSRAEIQAVLDCCGTPLLEAMGYGDMVTAAREAGAVDRGPEVTAAVLDAVETAFAARRGDVARAGTAAGVSEALSLATDRAFARPEEILATLGPLLPATIPPVEP